MGDAGDALGRSVVAHRPVVSVDADIDRISHDIEDINRAIEAYGRNADAKDAEIQGHLDRLDSLYTRLEEIPEQLLRSSDEFNEKITTMKVNVLKSIQLAIQKVRKRSPSQVSVSAKLQQLMSDREYNDAELRLFAVASGLIQKFKGIQSVGFDQLTPERQAEIDHFIDNYVDGVMSQYLEQKPDELTQYREEMPIFKKLCQDLLSQFLGTENTIPAEELKRKFLAMVCIIVITQDESFDANLTLLLDAVGKKQATKVAISTAAFAAAAALNPAITGTATTALSVLGEGLTVAGTSALGSIRAAVGAAWLTCASIRGLQLRHNEDWMFRRLLGGINDERRQIALDRIFGPRGQVVGGWDTAYLLRTLGRYGASMACGQVDVVQEMANDFADLPRTFLTGCNKITKAVTTKIGVLARKVIAAKEGEHVNPILLSRSGDVIDELLQLEEFRTLATDLAFTDHIKERVNYLDRTKGLRTSQLEEFLAHELAVYGVSSAWKRSFQNPDSGPTGWTEVGNSQLDPATVAIKNNVLGQTLDDRQMETTMLDSHGAYVGSSDPPAAQHLDTSHSFGPPLISAMDEGHFNMGPRSNVGPAPGQIVHQTTYPPPEAKAAAHARGAAAADARQQRLANARTTVARVHLSEAAQAKQGKGNKGNKGNGFGGKSRKNSKKTTRRNKGRKSSNTAKKSQQQRARNSIRRRRSSRKGRK